MELALRVGCWYLEKYSKGETRTQSNAAFRLKVPLIVNTDTHLGIPLYAARHSLLHGFTASAGVPALPGWGDPMFPISDTDEGLGLWDLHSKDSASSAPATLWSRLGEQRINNGWASATFFSNTPDFLASF